MKASHEDLRARGLKATRPRRLVLDLLREIGGHRSADEIAELLRQRGTPLPRGSVYAVIETLLEHHLIMLADAGPGRALYEAGTRWHHHFVCLVCGEVQDVPCALGSKPCLEPDGLDAEIVEAQIIFRGRCARCLKQEGEST
ncbi:MAG: Fur family transcriptional regulator [Candidatus Xenobia bacterium]